MTQKSVEILIGKLVTDEDLRSSFQRDPQTALRQLHLAGLELSPLEAQALSALDATELDRLARMLDPRLQKASLKPWLKTEDIR